MNKRKICILLPVVCFFLAIQAAAFDSSDLVIPDSAVPIVYGQSGLGRDLMAYQFGAGKNVMVLGFGLHGWEDNWPQDGGALVYAAGHLMNVLDENLDVVRDYDWTVYVLPSMNPDGLIDGYSHNGPGRATMSWLTAEGELRKDRGIDLNRCFPSNWTPYSNNRNFNGSSPMAAPEAQALSDFLQNAKGDGRNLFADVHGWYGQIVCTARDSVFYQAFHEGFPGNTYAGLTNMTGYLAWYAANLGYESCLLELPGDVYSLDDFRVRGYDGRFSGCILSLLKSCGTYLENRVMVSARKDPVCSGSGAVSGGASCTAGTTLTLRASPDEGSVFNGWFLADGTFVCGDPVFSFRPETDTVFYANFVKMTRLTVLSSRSGFASGAGLWPPGSDVRLSAHPAENFEGWYNEDGVLLSETAELSYSLNEDMTLIAMFHGDGYYDIPNGAWYLEDALEARRLGLVGGMNDVTFSAASPLTRGMAVTILARLDGLEMDGMEYVQTPFEDVPANAFYAGAVAWAVETGVAGGIDANHFCPGREISREQFMTMIIRYLTIRHGLAAEPSGEPVCKDANQIAPYARSAILQAQTLQFITGYADGSLRPKGYMNRASGAVVAVRLHEYLSSLATEETTDNCVLSASIQPRNCTSIEIPSGRELHPIY